MNGENIQHAINIMTRAKDAEKVLEMSYWQKPGFYPLTLKEEEHTCGTPCCFAGYIALSPEFQAAGGEVNKINGAPIYDEHFDSEAIHAWLEITLTQAAALCWCIGLRWIAYPRACKEFRQPTFDEIIATLQSLLDTGKLPGEQDE